MEDNNKASNNQIKNAKEKQLDEFKVDDREKNLTTNQGVTLSQDEFSLKAGDRGPTLMEDFHFREKITHFDHENKISNSDKNKNVEPLPESSRPRRDGPGGEDGD